MPQRLVRARVVRQFEPSAEDSGTMEPASEVSDPARTYFGSMSAISTSVEGSQDKSHAPISFVAARHMPFRDGVRLLCFGPESVQPPAS